MSVKSVSIRIEEEMLNGTNSHINFIDEEDPYQTGTDPAEILAGLEPDAVRPGICTSLSRNGWSRAEIRGRRCKW